MALPPPDSLLRLVKDVRAGLPNDWKPEPFNETRAKLAKYAKMGATAVLQTALQTGLTVASGAATFVAKAGAVSFSVFPLGSAAGPWLGAMAIGYKANGIFALHDLRASAVKKGDTAYTCSCGKCVENLTYVIDRKEVNVAIQAVGIFTAGVAIIGDRFWSMGKRAYQKLSGARSRKEEICTSLVTGARGGCVCAVASVMMICGEWKHEELPNRELAAEAIAVIWSSDGDLRLKSKW